MNSDSNRIKGYQDKQNGREFKMQEETKFIQSHKDTVAVYQYFRTVSKRREKELLQVMHDTIM